MDGGDPQATVHRASKSWTPLKWLSTHASVHAHQHAHIFLTGSLSDLTYRKSWNSLLSIYNISKSCEVNTKAKPCD